MLSEKIKELRLTKDMSQEDLAEILDVTRQSISKYENGSADPGLDKIRLIADYFDVSFDYLLDDKISTRDYQKQTVEEPKAQAKSVKETEDPNESTKHLPRIHIQSKIEDEDLDETYYKFDVVEKFPHIDYKPTALLMGVHSRTFVFENKTELAWYRTMEDAYREVEAIQEALANGETSYELQYDAPVKKRGFFSVQLADVEVDSE
ncbi:helix-turn-helix transcriptional regulator [Hutsoniella sourekii]|uniref:helix-turn-helix transcriptional regulator n=1 Tax=Hutsoniella sourekii TaxID=87650 RepID=UPI000481C165|nr:helix-turn-helix transcriptional regulator [Hutsoniella sourekii]